ncbi:MAG: hypothetical protein KC502_09990 [Myxococcales bacterium]|nr:hypothetical protein [Myxococcales bacterium]
MSATIEQRSSCIGAKRPRTWAIGAVLACVFVCGQHPAHAARQVKAAKPIARLDLKSGPQAVRLSSYVHAVAGGTLAWLGNSGPARATQQLVSLSSGERSQLIIPLAQWTPQLRQRLAAPAGSRLVAYVEDLPCLLTDGSRAVALVHTRLLLPRDPQTRRRPKSQQADWLVWWSPKARNPKPSWRRLPARTATQRTHTVRGVKADATCDAITLVSYGLLPDRSTRTQLLHATPTQVRVLATVPTKGSFNGRIFVANSLAVLAEYGVKGRKGPKPRAYLLDLRSGNVLMTTPAPNACYGAAIDSAGHRIWLYGAQNGVLWAVDAKTGRKLRSRRVGGTGHGLFRLPSGKLLLSRNTGLQWHDAKSLKRVGRLESRTLFPAAKSLHSEGARLMGHTLLLPNWRDRAILLNLRGK